MKVTVYSTTTCPYCKMLKDFLSGEGVEYNEKLIDQDDQAREEMMSLSGGFLGVPFTVIEKGSQMNTVVGFNKQELSQILGLGEK